MQSRDAVVAEAPALRSALRRSEDRSSELCAESREAAALCSTLSTRLDKQVDLNETLYHRLRASEAEAHGLRIEMEELRRGEELRAEALASKEASVRAWEAGRLKELPKLQVEIREQFKSEAKAHHRELQQQASRRLATAERRFHEEVHDLESELNQARYENALMGRKCHGSYQATAQAEAALHQAHHQMNMMNQELTFLRAEHARVQEELRLQKVHVGSHEERARQMEAQLKQAESRAARSEEVASDLHHWMLRSLHEVNRSAHPTGHPRGRQSLMHAESSNADILDKFRQSHQVKNGHGSRTR